MTYVYLVRDSKEGSVAVASNLDIARAIAQDYIERTDERGILLSVDPPHYEKWADFDTKSNVVVEITRVRVDFGNGRYY